MSYDNPVRAFERYLEQAGSALISASPREACALLSKAVTQFEIVLGDPHGIAVVAIAGIQNQLRNLTRLACEGERITSVLNPHHPPARCGSSTARAISFHMEVSKQVVV